MRRRYSKTDLLALSDLTATLGPPKRRQNEEGVLERAMMKWWKTTHGSFGVPEIALFKIKNEGRSGAVSGRLNKLGGVRRGVPDYMLAVVRLKNQMVDGVIQGDSYAGLFLELKRRDGVLSPEQEVFHEILRKQGYQCAVCWSLQECIDTITAYLAQ